jgi:hypothetical protein
MRNKPGPIGAFEARCAAALDQQIALVQQRIIRCAEYASHAAPDGVPDKFLTAINALRTDPKLMLNVAPEFRKIVEMALSDVGA